MPSINTESSLDFEKNNSYNKINNSNNKLSNLNCQTKPSIQIENTRIKTESSKEEKNIIDKNQLKENNQKEIILEKNPFFLGKNLCYIIGYLDNQSNILLLFLLYHFGHPYQRMKLLQNIHFYLFLKKVHIETI